MKTTGKVTVAGMIVALVLVVGAAAFACPMWRGAVEDARSSIDAQLDAPAMQLPKAPTARSLVRAPIPSGKSVPTLPKITKQPANASVPRLLDLVDLPEIPTVRVPQKPRILL